MSIFNKIFNIKNKKSVTSIEELNGLFSSRENAWASSSQLKQYSKSLYVYAAVNKIATKVAAIELQLYKIISKTGDSEEVLNHEILDLMSKINPFQTRTEFLKTAWINKKLTGEAFWVKIRNNRGKVVELWNLRPDLVTVITDPVNYIKYYEFQKLDGKKEIFQREDIIHFKDPNPLDQFRGMSPVGVSRHRIETEEQAVRYQRDFFKNNARPDALLVTEQQLSDDQRGQMTSSWEERHQGEGSSSKIGLLEGGLKYQQVSISQREMDYIESMKFTRDDILVAFGVPKSVITTDEINYANAESGIRAFLSETIQPEMQQLTEVLNEFLISPDFGEEFYLDFKDPTPADRAAMRADHTAGYGKWLTTNEIRRDDNLPEIEGGDVIAVQQNNVSPFADPSLQLSFSNTLSKRKAMKHLQGRPMLRKKFELIEALTKEVTTQITKDMMAKKKAATIKTKVKKSKTVKDEQKLASMMPDKEVRKNYFDMMDKRINNRAKDFHGALLKEFDAQHQRVLKTLNDIETGNKGVYSKMRHDEINALLDKQSEDKVFALMSLPFLQEYAKQGGEDAAELLGDVFNMTDALKKAIEKRSRFFASTVNDTTFQKLVASVSDGVNAGEGIGELTARVNEIYTEIPQWRAGMIARTEATNATNEGHLEEFRQSDIVKGKEWIATMDDRTRDEHAELDGEKVYVDATFSNGLMYPMEPNCRCVLAPAMFD